MAKKRNAEASPDTVTGSDRESKKYLGQPGKDQVTNKGKDNRLQANFSTAVLLPEVAE